MLVTVSLNPSRSHLFFFCNRTAPTDIYTLSLHDALPIYHGDQFGSARIIFTDLLDRLARIDLAKPNQRLAYPVRRSEEHTSELQSLRHLVCRLLLEKKKKKERTTIHQPHN